MFVKPPSPPLESTAPPPRDRFSSPYVAIGLDAAQGVRGPWGENSNLTILLHGRVDEATRAQQTAIVQSWRQMLPGVQVGFAASEIDHNLSSADRDFWKKSDLDQLDNRRTKLIRQLSPELDFLVEGRPMEALPPLKFDEKPNNCNKMLVSVQAGLSAVDTPWVLRVRSDVMLRHTARISHAYEHFARTVGRSKLFNQPIAVAPFYTLNPYGLERMSYHISDWYNLGLTDDVCNYWNVAPMSLADASYFEGSPHAAHSNTYERAMRARMPPEMLIATSFAARNGCRVPSYFNELGYEGDGLAFLRENFVMPDPDVIGMSMAKYARERRWVLTSLLVISSQEWAALAEGGEPAFMAATKAKRHILKIADLRRKANFISVVRRSWALRALGWVLRG